MKILGIAPYQFLPAQTGGQKCIEIFYRSLGAEANTIVASVKKNEEAFAKNYILKKIFSNLKSRYGNPFYYFLLLKLIRNNNITHLITEHPYLGWLAIALKKKTGVKFIVHSHNIESLRFKSIKKSWWKILWHYEKWVHQHADYNFFITEKDRQFAIVYFKLKPAKCAIALYGTEAAGIPSAEEKKRAKANIYASLNISFSTKILLFNGNFFYKPNTDALFLLINTIVPLLNADKYDFKLIVCGKGIPDELKTAKPENVILMDFVPDINLYNLGADIFLNPVTDGGGIKTKLVEALAADVSVVSARSGAIGVNPEWCGSRLTIVEDNDWTGFYQAIINMPAAHEPVSPVFFEHFYMGNIAKKVKTAMQLLLL